MSSFQQQTIDTVSPAFVPELGMVVVSDAMRALLALVDRVARSFASVLITGESGTGKELIARAIHMRSPRRDKAFVDLNCAALPEHLIESELFGYERGAFSGADQGKPGMFEIANKGSIFLDEIGEIDGRVQAKLLRVLDGNSYYRLGGKQKINTDVRVIAATNRQLDGNYSGRFRLDLYHRLSQFQLHVPPLRERVEDIIPIAENYLQSIGSECLLSEDAKNALLAYAWPGNVRELRNVLVPKQFSARWQVRVDTRVELLIVSEYPAAPSVGSSASTEWKRPTPLVHSGH